VARRFNEMGITAFVLKYRLPSEGHENSTLVPLQDAQRAIRLIRSQASRFNIDPQKIGVIGFSAGGHLASMLGTSWDRKSYSPQNILDSLTARPDFMILLYPVISMNTDHTHGGSQRALLGENPDSILIHQFSSEELTRPDAPPTFLVVTEDDSTVDPQNSYRFQEALRESNVPVKLQHFPYGGHGFGIEESIPVGAAWPDLCESWLLEMGFLEKL
jgi:acetyl esterase/lipase